MSEKQYTAEELYEYIEHYTSIYDEKGEEINPIPDDIKVTVYCNGGDAGFVENVTKDEMGFSIFIATKWILQATLDKLLENRIGEL